MEITNTWHADVASQHVGAVGMPICGRTLVGAPAAPVMSSVRTVAPAAPIFGDQSAFGTDVKGYVGLAARTRGFDAWRPPSS